MIEAVNSAVANAQVARGSAEQIDAARALAASSERLRSAIVPQAPYVSPYIAVDVNYNKAVLQIRDSETGDVLRQFPSQSRLEALQREAAAKLQAGGVFQKAEAPEVREQASQTGVSDIGGGSNGGVGFVAQAQVASAALAAGARAGIENLSAGVSVLA